MDEAVHAIAVEALLNQHAENRQIHQRGDAFAELNETQFKAMYRVSKEIARFIITTLEPYLIPQQRINDLDINTKVLVALRFYASGSYQLDIASNYNLNISQASASRCIREVTDALNHPDVFNRFVSFPQNIDELNILRTQFQRVHHFPGVIGCLDCTHVAIVPPKQDENYPEHLYVNRKNYHSLNVQLICDYRLKVINVKASFPGSTNDAFIWSTSNVQQVMRQLHFAGHVGYFLLGDSGYPLRPWLLTPLEHEPIPGTPQHRYQLRHKSVRSIIERCNGVLKARYRCLLKHRVLHYTPDVAGRIVNACVVLHNICIDNGIEEIGLEMDVDENDLGFVVNYDIRQGNAANRVNPELAQGRAYRNRIIQTLH